MRSFIGVIVLCAASISGFCQSPAKYQVATILEVKAHQSAGDSTSDPVSYDVSARVGDTIYVVLYTPALGEIPQKYAAGREILVLVGPSTVTCNDLLGRSFEVPIESRRPAEAPRRSK